MRAMPAIRVVNHLADGRMIIIRSHPGSAIVTRTGGDGIVVCYEADELEPAGHLGWSVVMTGRARLVTDPALVTRAAATRRNPVTWLNVSMTRRSARKS